MQFPEELFCNSLIAMMTQYYRLNLKLQFSTSVML